MEISDLSRLIEAINAGGGGQTNRRYKFLQVGEAFLFRSVTHIELGRITKVDGEFVFIEEASWIAETGRYSDTFKIGPSNLGEVEPYPIGTWVNVEACTNIVPWPHDLPREQK